MFHRSEGWFTRTLARKCHGRSLKANRRRPVLESLEERTLLSVALRLDDARVLSSGAEDPVVYADTGPGTPSTPPSTNTFGFDPASLTIQSGSAFPEQFDLHGEYLSLSPTPPPNLQQPGQS